MRAKVPAQELAGQDSARARLEPSGLRGIGTCSRRGARPRVLDPDAFPLAKLEALALERRGEPFVTTADVPNCAIRHVGASITRPRAVVQGKLPHKRVSELRPPEDFGPRPKISQFLA